MAAEKKSAKGNAARASTGKGGNRGPNPQATIGRGRVEVKVDLGPGGGTALATEAPPARLK
jgi:hypothetical protein